MNGGFVYFNAFHGIGTTMVWYGMVLTELCFGPLLLDPVEVDVDFFVVEAELRR